MFHRGEGTAQAAGCCLMRPPWHSRSLRLQKRSGNGLGQRGAVAAAHPAPNCLAVARLPCCMAPSLKRERAQVAGGKHGRMCLERLVQGQSVELRAATSWDGRQHAKQHDLLLQDICTEGLIEQEAWNMAGVPHATLLQCVRSTDAPLCPKLQVQS